jgi:hypothetical protein
LLGSYIHSEIHTNKGSIDAVIEQEGCILIFEFKINKSADVALQTILDKKYPEKYQNSGKVIQLFGVNFSTKDRNIADWKTKIWEK